MDDPLPVAVIKSSRYRRQRVDREAKRRTPLLLDQLAKIPTLDELQGQEREPSSVTERVDSD